MTFLRHVWGVERPADVLTKGLWKARKWEEWARKEKEGEAMAQGKEMDEMRVEIQELKGMVYELLHKEV